MQASRDHYRERNAVPTAKATHCDKIINKNVNEHNFSHIYKRVHTSSIDCDQKQLIFELT